MVEQLSHLMIALCTCI